MAKGCFWSAVIRSADLTGQSRAFENGQSETIRDQVKPTDAGQEVDSAAKRIHFYRTMSVIWIVPSVGSVAIIGLDRIREVVTILPFRFEDWVAFGILQVQLWLILRFRRAVRDGRRSKPDSGNGGS